MASRVGNKRVEGVGTNRTFIGAKFLTTTNGAFSSTAATTKLRGVASVTRNSAGKYTLVLNDAWPDVLSMIATIIGVAAVPPNGKASVAEILSYTASTKTLVVQFLLPNGAGYTAADVEDGATISLEFGMDQGAI